MTTETKLLLIEAVQKAKREAEVALGTNTAIFLYSPVLQELARSPDSLEEMADDREHDAVSQERPQASEIPWDFPSRSTGYLLNVAQEVSNALGERGMCLYKPHKQPLTIGARDLTSDEKRYIQASPNAPAPSKPTEDDPATEVISLIRSVERNQGLSKAEIGRRLGWYSSKIYKIVSESITGTDNDLHQLRQLAGRPPKAPGLSLSLPTPKVAPGILVLSAQGLSPEMIATTLDIDPGTVQGVIMRAGRHGNKGPTVKELRHCPPGERRARLLKKGYPDFSLEGWPIIIREVLSAAIYGETTQ